LVVVDAGQRLGDLETILSISFGRKFLGDFLNLEIGTKLKLNRTKKILTN
jgi:hypothetical protein